jgi:FkbM family methyltransferase
MKAHAVTDDLPDWVQYYPHPTSAKERRTSDDRHHFVEFDLDGKRLCFSVRDPMSRWRVRTLFEKEPETHYWLGSLPAGDVFYDIGANIGLYSIYATIMSGVRTFAFEPESQNFAGLHENIFLNDLFDRCTGWCLAFGEKPIEISHLALSEFHVGRSLHSFGGEAPENGLRQGCMALSLDHLVYDLGMEAPNHIKIDVDGNEAAIICGAKRLLTDPRLRSVVVEFNDVPETYSIMEAFRDAGFEISFDQLRITRDGLRDAGEVKRLVAERRWFGNVLFSRDPALFDGARAVIARHLEAKGGTG